MYVYMQERRAVVLSAETGSGKTLSYLVPVASLNKAKHIRHKQQYAKQHIKHIDITQQINKTWCRWQV